MYMYVFNDLLQNEVTPQNEVKIPYELLSIFQMVIWLDSDPSIDPLSFQGKWAHNRLYTSGWFAPHHDCEVWLNRLDIESLPPSSRGANSDSQRNRPDKNCIKLQCFAKLVATNPVGSFPTLRRVNQFK